MGQDDTQSTQETVQSKAEQGRNVTISNSQGIIIGDHGTVNILNYPDTLTSSYTPEPIPPLNQIPAVDPGQYPGWRMPFNRNVLFTGREAEIRRLAKALFFGGSSAVDNELTETKRSRRQVVVTQGNRRSTAQGIGGVGKTQLVIEFCYRYGRFTRGVHWLNLAQAKTISDLNSELAECGRIAGVTPWPEKLPEQAEVTLNAFRQSPDRLVILDNLEEPNLLDDLLPRLGKVLILITTRRADLPIELGLRTCKLDVFSPAESRRYLRKAVPRLKQVDNKELDALAERLGRLPLALHLAASYLRVCINLGPTEYLTEIEQMESGLKVADLPESLAHSPTRHDLDLYATFLMSWNLLGNSEEDQKAKYFFGLPGTARRMR